MEELVLKLIFSNRILDFFKFIWYGITGVGILNNENPE